LSFNPRAHPGLSAAEVAERVRRGETNRFKARVGRSYWEIIRDNVFNLFNVVLFTLLVIVLLYGDYPTVIFAGFSVVWNSLLGMYQEIDAKRKLDKLAALAAHNVKVVRDGAVQEIRIAEVVKDDVLPIEPGDRMVVDGVVIATDALEMDESQLTGESDAVLKEPDDKITSGSFVIAGTGVMVATKVGKDSAINQLSTIAKAYKRVLTPTQQKLEAIVQISVVIMAICVPMIFVKGYLDTGELIPTLEVFRNAVVFTTSLVPQGLVLTAILSLTIGALSISRFQTLVQRVNAVESMANVTTLCFDKTGTLTRNQLSVTRVQPIDGISEAKVRENLSLYINNLGHLNRTAAAIAHYANGDGVQHTPTRAKLRELPFNSARKWGAIILDDETLVMGAPERIVAHDEHVAAVARDYARQGLRVLAFARLPGELADGVLPAEREALALIILSDQVREDIQSTLQEFRDQEVNLKVISGDNLETVKEIAHESGLPTEPAYTGDELKAMSADDFEAAAASGSLFARIEPDTKRQIIAALKKRGEYVAMVGDGVNDVPALKEAQLAVVMNDGAQIAKDVADIVLLNNAMSTLPKAFHEGRIITQTIFATCKIFLVKNIYSLLFFIFAGFMLMPFPISPIQISWVTFGIINIPAGLIAIRVIKPIHMKTFRYDVLDYVITAGVVSSAGMALVYAFAFLSNGGDVDIARSTMMIFFTYMGVLVLWNVNGLYVTQPASISAHPRLFVVGIVLAILTLLAGWIVPNILEWKTPGVEEWLVASAVFVVVMLIIEITMRDRKLVKPIWLLAKP
jgi:cation-transporting P-type ATPase E